uniref:Retrotransposable element Tf2 n=1 Tax=Cajanus cajan TaxID=3821 RepID=A0A151RGQ8_CAJCA|nr:Retrotransposable element Tf2 [Cajanus cajan]
MTAEDIHKTAFKTHSGHYERFVKGYSTIAKPLNDMLKKDGFTWSSEAKLAFQCLKVHLSQAPVLALPDFTQPFVLEVDASGIGLGAVLMQNHHPIAFISRTLNMQQQVECTAISTHQPNSELLDAIKTSWQVDDSLQKLIAEVQLDPSSHKAFSWTGGELRRKGRLVVGNDSELRRKILDWLHSSASGGHSGRDATYQRIKSVVYWKGLSKDVRRFIHQCPTCQQCKYDNSASPGLLQPLPIPDMIWQHITMDFIEGLPNSLGKQVIFVVVDRLSKAAHFMALKHPYTASEVAQCFMDNIYKLHGCPASITSDRDPVFISNFWRDFMASQGIQVQLSTAYHPQTDGQTEVVNRCLETYLRCMCSDDPTNCPYEIMYGQPPPAFLPYLPGESKIELVDRSLHKREEQLKMVKFHMRRAQDRMKQLADKGRFERTFEVGDLVFVKLHPYRQVYVAFRGNAKLAPKYYGPYAALDKIGFVAYKIQLPAGSSVHNVFHVSQLKKFVGTTSTSTHCPMTDEETRIKELEAIIERMSVKRGNQAVTKVLVKWKHLLPEEATWEFLFDLKKKFPNFNP